MPFVFKDFIAVAYPDERLIISAGIVDGLEERKTCLSD